MLLPKTLIVQVVGSLVLTVMMTFAGYGAFATCNWYQVNWMRDMANSIRSLQNSAASGHTALMDQSQAPFYFLTTSDDSTYERILAESPKVGPIRFGVSWDSVTGERLSTWEVVLAKGIELWCVLLVAGVMGFGLRRLLDGSFKRQLTDRVAIGEMISSSLVGSAAAVASPLLGIVVWYACYDRSEKIRSSLGTFWPSLGQELFAVGVLAGLSALIAAWKYTHHAKRFYARLGEHCVKCGYPLSRGGFCPECGPEVGLARGAMAEVAHATQRTTA